MVVGSAFMGFIRTYDNGSMLHHRTGGYYFYFILETYGNLYRMMLMNYGINSTSKIKKVSG